MPGLPDDVRSEIRDRADGIPLYAVETVRMLLDRGALERDGEILRWSGASTTSTCRRRCMRSSRLASMVFPGRARVIEHAAVLGKTFPRARCRRARRCRAPMRSSPCWSGWFARSSSSSMRTHAPPSAGSTASSRRSSSESLTRRSRRRSAGGFIASRPRTSSTTSASTLTRSPRSSRRTIAMRAQFDPTGESAAGDRASARGWLARAGERAAALGAPEDAQRAFDDAATI